MKRRTHLTISAFCVFLSITLFFFLNSSLSPKLEGLPWAAPFIGHIAGVGFYVTFYKLSLWLYFKYFEDVLHSNEAIAGEWIYKLVINPNGGENNFRVGKCYIEKGTNNTLKISGVHFNPVIKKFTSHFISEFVEIDGDNIHVMYYAIGVTSGLDATKGMFFLKSVGNPPKTIHGFWSDVIPSRNSGSITLVKADAESEAILEELGHPKDSSHKVTVFSDELKYNLEQSLKGSKESKPSKMAFKKSSRN